MYKKIVETLNKIVVDLNLVQEVIEKETNISYDSITICIGELQTYINSIGNEINKNN
jgi:hypothetical protein